MLFFKFNFQTESSVSSLTPSYVLHFFLREVGKNYMNPQEASDPGITILKSTAYV